MPATRQRLRLVDDFAARLARHGLSIHQFAVQAGMSSTTLYGLLNPARHPTRSQRSGMYPKTARKVAEAYAALVGCTADEAFDELIIARDAPVTA